MFRKRVLAYTLCIVIVVSFIIFPTGCNNGDDYLDADNNDVENNNEQDNTDNKQDNIDNEQDVVNFVSERERKNIQVPFIPTQFETLVQPYKVNEDLSNIENIKQFGEFTDEQKSLLSKNGFVVVPTNEEQLFYIYENNEYMKLPSFVTTDSVLQVYHIFFNYSLRILETEKLIGYTEELTESMIDKSVYLYNKATNEEIKKVLLKNISFFCTAWLCLEKELPDDIPIEAADLAKAEYKLILGEAGFLKSKIFPYDLDYSQYKPRGHYTRNDDFKRYFRAMMWYGQVPFSLYIINDNMEEERNIEQTLQALLITYSVFLERNDSNDIELWENIYDTTNLYVGASDDLTIYHYKDLLIDVYGNNPDINILNDEDKLDKVYLEAEKLPEPQIKAQYSAGNIPVGKQLRFMGQRYIPDAEIIQDLVEPFTRPIPSGLDVMGVIGSERAYDIQINVNNEDDKWEQYPIVFEELKEKFDGLSQDEWQSNMYYGWMWTLKGLLNKYEEGYPSFMTNQAWEDKSLSTALASWSQLKHDTILYGKQTGAECGGGVEPPKIRGYVEPNIEVYEKLLWLTKYSRENLNDREILVPSLEYKLQDFEDLLEFLINCSVKQLKNEPLTEDEYYQLLTYGGLLEYLTSSFAGDGMRWFEITSETDKNMAVIADIHTIAGVGYFEVGVGPAYEIFAVVPIDDKLYLTRGAVFSYYEFTSETRLTDEEWQKIIKEGKEPPQLEWMKNFINGDKKEIPLPTEPYNSGC